MTDEAQKAQSDTISPGLANGSFDHKFKILILGDAGAGKTSLTRRFALDDFHTSYMATIGIDFLEDIIEVKGEKVKLQIWDTAGQERFRTLIRPYYRGASGIALVYDVTDVSTFDHLTQWMVAIEENVQQHQIIQKVILANKCDLDDGRKVSQQRGSELAEGYQVPYFEVSAKTGANVREAFFKLAELVLEAKQPVISTTNKVEMNFQPSQIDVRNGKKKKGKKCCEIE